jgi:DNA-binding NtrC family response regulator
VLINRLSEQTSEEFYKPVPHYPERVMDRLMQYSWPGNVRELKNFVHRMILQRAGDNVRHADVEGFLGNGLDMSNDSGFPSMEQMERQHLERALRLCRGKIGGQDGAAVLLDMPRTTLQYRLKRFKLKPKDFS